MVRDTYGVPHIFGATGEDVAYASGYAQAQDRLWLLHILRLLGTGTSSELFGPVTSPTDKVTRFFGYTEAERTRFIAAYPERARALLQAYVDGINAWTAAVIADPAGKLPLEYVTFQVGMPTPWKIEDVIAIADLFTYALGSSGGAELSHAALLKDLVARFGESQGLAMFDDLVPTIDPDAIPTVPPEFEYKKSPTHARQAEVDAVRTLVSDARFSLAESPLPASAPSVMTSGRKAAIGTKAQLALMPDVNKPMKDAEAMKQARRNILGIFFKTGSNGQVVGPQLSKSGNALITSGAQNGLYLPSLHYDFGLHSADGTYDVMGFGIPGSGPVSAMGQGKGYFYSSTTGFTDNYDTFVVKLGPTPRSYMFNGAVEQMDCRVETYQIHGAPSEVQEICRTRHGPVVSFDEVNGVAYAYKIGWYGRTEQLVRQAFGWQNAKSLEDFSTISHFSPASLNQFYADDQGNYAYWHHANYPLRPPGVDIRLPKDGSGGSEWLGLVPIQEMPHAVNFGRGWAGNWNSQPAADFPIQRDFSPTHRYNSLHRAIDPTQSKQDPFGGAMNPDGQFNFEDMSANLRFAAFKDHEDTSYRQFLPPPEALTTELGRKALTMLQEWDGFNHDADGDGLYHAGLSISDAWIETMRSAAFKDEFPDYPGGFVHPSWPFVQDIFPNGGVLWHVINTQDKLQYKYDWLNGETPAAFVARTFEAAAASLATEYNSQDPSAWRQAVFLSHYARLNADLYADTASGGTDTGDSGLPGDAPDHIFMDRGTSNVIIEWLNPPSGSGKLGEAARQAGNVLPPGQSGFIDLEGVEDKHFQDQLDNYINWKYKPNPMTLAEVCAVMESEFILSRSGVTATSDTCTKTLRAGSKVIDAAKSSPLSGGAVSALLLLMLAGLSGWKRDSGRRH